MELKARLNQYHEFKKDREEYKQTSVKSILSLLLRKDARVDITPETVFIPHASIVRMV